MEAAAFFIALARRTRLACNARDPLAEARRFLDENGNTGEAQALRKVIRTIATLRGEFSEAEVWLFSAETCALVAALLDTRDKGLYTEEEWRL